VNIRSVPQTDSMREFSKRTYAESFFGGVSRNCQTQKAAFWNKPFKMPDVVLVQ
jgi:hypothetical protein